jgi:hypothetical protein
MAFHPAAGEVGIPLPPGPPPGNDDTLQARAEVGRPLPPGPPTVSGLSVAAAQPDAGEVAPLGKLEEKRHGDKLVYSGQEDMRRLALFTVAGLLSIVLVSVGLGIVFGRGNWDHQREFLEIAFVPLVGLFGTAIAYYYTSK